MQKEKSNTNGFIRGIVAIVFYLISSAFTYDFIKLFGIDYNSLNSFLRQIYLIVYEIITTLIIIYIYKFDFIPDLIDFKKNIKRYISKYIKYWFIMLGIMILSSLIVTIFTTTKVSNNQSTIIELLGSYPIYTLTATIIIAPLLEELIFRLSLKKIFINNTLFIIMSGLIFGSMHVIGSFNSPIDLLFIIPYSIPGFMFAYIYTKSNNICVPIWMHFMHNSIMVLLQLITSI